MEITLKPTPRQHQANLALNDPEVDTLFFGGGAGGGKSWWLCEDELVYALRYPGYKSFIGRNELKRLMQSTFLTFSKVSQYHGVSHLWKLNGQYNYIDFENGSRIDLLDLKFLPADPLYERFGSLEYTRGKIEEAGEVHFLAYDVLKSRVGRHMNKEFGIKPSLGITGNPKKNWTYTLFYKRQKDGTLPRNMAFVQALYQDNEHTAHEYGKQLASISDKATKERLMFGNWEYDDDPSALIEFDAITDLFTNAAEPSEKSYITADIARYGSDKTVLYLWKGLTVEKVQTYEKQGLDITAERIRELAHQETVPFSQVLIDEDGVGGGVVDILRGVKGFTANATPFDNPKTGKPDNYQNLKTQCAYLLADYVNNHRIAIKTSDMKFREMLTEELEQIKSKDADKDGKRQIVPKDIVKEMIGRSPDYSDCLLMRMYFELKKVAFIPTTVQGGVNHLINGIG